MNFAGNIHHSAGKMTETAQAAANLQCAHVASANAAQSFHLSKPANAMAGTDILHIHPTLTGQRMGIGERADRRVTSLSQACASAVTLLTSQSEVRAPQQIAEAA